MPQVVKKTIFLVILLAFTGVTHALKKRNKFASAHSIALDGVITEGYLYSKVTLDWSLKKQIKGQLMYTIGQLNGLNGGAPDMNRLQISIQDKTPTEDGYNKITYSAKLFIAWPIERPVPENYRLILPAKADSFFLRNFKERFGNDERTLRRCIDRHVRDMTSDMFWYHYRPERARCPLSHPENFDKTDIARFDIQLSKSDKNTKGKFPEYGKIWEDGKLVITAIFGKADEKSNSKYDPGIQSYTDTINSLQRLYGIPVHSNIKRGLFNEPLKNPEVHMLFNTPKGLLDVSLFLVTGIRAVPPGFREKYNERTLSSDFISYSGHAGLGANIRALARMGEFAPNQYQIFLINGCDTFAYVDNALKNAHHYVNPDFEKDKFIDVITNAMPSYFHMNAHTNMTVINALVRQSQTYEQILSGFDMQQRAVVTGEQDNNWPDPFLN